MAFSKIQVILLLMLGAVFTASGFTPINNLLGPMLGVVPLLLVEEQIYHSSKKRRTGRVWASAFLFFVVFHLCAQWWVINAHWSGLVAGVTVNSLFFATVFMFFHLVKRKYSYKSGYFALIAFWVGWEYIELLDWDLSWPWVTLGFMPADYPALIQWYSFTGALGGSLWFLAINILVFFYIKSWMVKEDAFVRFQKLLKVIYLVFVPIVISLIQFFTYEVPSETVDVVVIQPNREPIEDPFVNKMMAGPNQPLDIAYNKRGNYMLSLADSVMDDQVDYVFLPETAVQGSIWGALEHHRSLWPYEFWLNKYPNTNLITGINRYWYYDGPTEELPPYVMRSGDGEFYQRSNAAIQLNTSDSIPIYHKSRLVIGVERIPSYFVFFQRYLGDFEHDENAVEYNPNNSTQEERTVFTGVDGTKVAPIICYESVFGEYTTDFVKKGAQFLAVITNDGWWRDTPGYKQHWSFSKLRAIETRRAVARSANTGWSGFINPDGTEIYKSAYYYPGAFRAQIPLNNELTFFVRYGDIIGRGCAVVGVLFLLNLVARSRKKVWE